MNGSVAVISMFVCRVTVSAVGIVVSTSPSVLLCTPLTRVLPSLTVGAACCCCSSLNHASSIYSIGSEHTPTGSLSANAFSTLVLRAFSRCCFAARSSRFCFLNSFLAAALIFARSAWDGGYCGGERGVGRGGGDGRRLVAGFCCLKWVPRWIIRMTTNVNAHIITRAYTAGSLAAVIMFVCSVIASAVGIVVNISPSVLLCIPFALALKRTLLVVDVVPGWGDALADQSTYDDTHIFPPVIRDIRWVQDLCFAHYRHGRA